MAYDKILSLLDDKQGFEKYILSIYENGEFNDLYYYIDEELNYKTKKNIIDLMIENDKLINILTKISPFEVQFKMFNKKGEYEKIKNKLSDESIDIILKYVENRDLFEEIYEEILFLIKIKDNDMLFKFIHIFNDRNKDNLSISKNYIDNISEVIYQNYNSNKLVNDFLDTLKNLYIKQEEEKKKKEEEERRQQEKIENVLTKIKPILKSIYFEYMKPNIGIDKKKVVIIIDDKKYTMTYDYFLRLVIRRSRYFIKDGVNYYLTNFLAKQFEQSECIFPIVKILRKEDDNNIYNITFSTNYVNPEYQFNITNKELTPNQITFIKLLVDKMMNCSYGFQPISIYSLGESNTILGHAISFYFERQDNNITIYYYDPHGHNIYASGKSYGSYEFLEYIVQHMNKLYPDKNINIEFTTANCRIGLQAYVGDLDIGMCETWTLFWMFLVLRTLVYVNKNNIDMQVKDFLPLIEKYYTENLDEENLYTLLVSFLAKLYVDFSSEKPEFINHLKQILKTIKKSERGLIITDISDRESYELEKLKKEYKEHVDKLATKKDEFLLRKQAFESVRENLKKEEKLYDLREGKKLFQSCERDLECSSKCCKNFKNGKKCMPIGECRMRHVYGKGFK